MVGLPLASFRLALILHQLSDFLQLGKGVCMKTRLATTLSACLVALLTGTGLPAFAEEAGSAAKAESSLPEPRDPTEFSFGQYHRSSKMTPGGSVGPETWGDERTDVGPQVEPEEERSGQPGEERSRSSRMEGDSGAGGGETNERSSGKSGTSAASGASGASDREGHAPRRD